MFKKIAWIWSHHLQWKFKLLAGKFTWGNKAKHCWVMSTNLLFSKVCWQHPAVFCLYTSSKFFPPIIWIFTEGEGDRIEFRLPFKIFSTLNKNLLWTCTQHTVNLSTKCTQPVPDLDIKACRSNNIQSLKNFRQTI